MQITRKYAHKTFGDIGSVAIEFPTDTWILNDVELPVDGVRAIVNHGLQILQDAYAGAKTADQAAGDWQKKLDKVLAGTVATRETGPRNPFETECRRLAEIMVLNALKAKGIAKPKNFKDLVAATREKHAATIEPEATENLAKAAELDVIDLDDLFAE